MTISSISRRAGPYAGNGVTVTFAFAFKVTAASDLLVLSISATGVETTLVLGGNYGVALNADQEIAPGGTITVFAAPAVGTSVLIVSNVPSTQPADITNASGFYPKVVGDALDRITMVVQQLAERAGRTLTLSPGSGPLALLPGAATRAGKFLAFDGNGDPVAASGTGADGALRTDLAAFGGAALVGYRAPGSSTTRSAAQRFADVISVKDFGVLGDGSDETSAMTSMVSQINAAYSGSNRPFGLYWPGGLYTHGNTLGFDRPISLFGRGDATLNYTGNSFQIRLGPTNLLNSPGAFAYQEMTVDGLRFTGGANAVHGIYISDSVFEPRIRNCVWDDFGSPTGGSVYGIFGQANNWNTLIENCRMFVQNRPAASGVNFICINGVSGNGVPDGGNSRVLIDRCWMTPYNPGNFLGAFANINATHSVIARSGFQTSSRGIILREGCNGVLIKDCYSEFYTNNASFIEHTSSGSGASYQSPQGVKIQDCYVNFHHSDGVTGGRFIRPFDATARIIDWEIDGLFYANIAQGQVLVEQNNLTGQMGNSFRRVLPFNVPRATDSGFRPNFPQIQSNVDPWACGDARRAREVGASFTLTREDANAIIIATGGSMAITVPPSGAAPFIPVLSTLRVRNTTGGAQTIVPGAGVTLVLASSGATGTRTLAANAFAELTCVGSNLWIVEGPGVS